MFNVKSLKGLSVFLAMLIIFTGVSSNFVSAQGLTEVSSNAEIVTFDEGVFLYEYITDNSLGETLRMTNLSTNEEQVLFKDGENIYLKKAHEENLKVGSVKIDESNLSSFYPRPRSAWTNFGPDRYNFDLVGVTSVAVAAGVIALALGGPVAGITVALRALSGANVFNGIYAMK